MRYRFLQFWQEILFLEEVTKNYLLVFLSAISLHFVSSCSKEKSDQELLERDCERLEKHLVSYKVTPYKFGKIAIRSSVATDSISRDYQNFKADLNGIADRVIHYENVALETPSVKDYITMYRDYKKMEDFVRETDEDVFPTLTDVINTLQADSNQTEWTLLQGQDKIETQNIEHAFLSVVALGTKNLGKEIALYECSKTNPELLPSSEIKTLLQLMRGLLFLDKKLYYLSEDELTRNIQWLDSNPNMHLPLTRHIFDWGHLNNQQAHTALHGLNHMLRAIDRFMMEREIDHERAIDDLEVFLTDAREIGLDNEIIWAVETYVYIENEETDKAIEALSKLKQSDLLSSRERQSIDEYIAYLKNREPGSKLNKVYDKFFLGKIATKYVIRVVKNVDWNQFFEEHNMESASRLLETIHRLEELTEGLYKLSHVDNMKEEGKKLEDKGLELLDKAREAL